MISACFQGKPFNITVIQVYTQAIDAKEDWFYEDLQDFFNGSDGEESACNARDRIPSELFQILKDDAVQVCTQCVGKFGKLSRGHRTGKGRLFILVPKKGNAKECSNCHPIALILHASKVMLKILQARLQQHINRELPDVQTGFRKDRGTRDQIANIHRIIEKAKEVLEKHLLH